MNPSNVLARGRAARVLVMRDTVRVTTPSGPPVFNDTTGEYTPAGAATTVYEGIADVKPRDISSGQVDAGERQVVTLDYDMALPWTATPAVKVDYLVEILTSDDPLFVGQVLTVTDVAYGARRTAHHYTCQNRL